MPDAVVIGPVLLRSVAVAGLAGVLVAMLVLSALARLAVVDGRWLDRLAWQALLAGVVLARAAHVAQHWPAYSDRPLTALALWQPGFDPWYGVLAALALVFWRLASRAPAERWRLLGVAAAAAGAGSAGVASVMVAITLHAPAQMAAGQVLPSFVMADLGGRRVGSHVLAARPAIVNLWATWCPPCRREMPLLDEVAREYVHRGLQVVGVDVAEAPAVVAAFVQAAGVGYEIWVDPPSAEGESPSRVLLEATGSPGLPVTLFVAADGRVAGVYIGELTRALLLEWAERLSSSPVTSAWESADRVHPRTGPGLLRGQRKGALRRRGRCSFPAGARATTAPPRRRCPRGNWAAAAGAVAAAPAGKAGAPPASAARR